MLYIFFLEEVLNPDKIFFTDQGVFRRESTSSLASTITPYKVPTSTFCAASLVNGVQA